MEYEKRLIEGNFPCQQVGAETKRERGASSALPPLYFLHVWWARRPLTPSRAAVLGSILPADVEPDVFLKELGIVKKQAVIGDARWTLVGKNLALIQSNDSGEFIPYSEKFAKAFEKENARRAMIQEKLCLLRDADPSLSDDPVFRSWYEDNHPLPMLQFGRIAASVESVPADPAATNERIDFAASKKVADILGEIIKIDPEDLYAYGRAYETPINVDFSNVTVLDPTAGGGSIPFEAMRLGCNVIANDLNPVATGIEMATLKYPAEYGKKLIDDIKRYGTQLERTVAEKTAPFYNFEKAFGDERKDLLRHCGGSRKLFEQFDVPEYDQQGLLYCREVTCPHCGERAPLLNAFALSKKKDGWMVVPQIEGFPGHGTVQRGTGTCIFCGQAIESEEIKRQARGESAFGSWADRLYCVVGVREQPKLGKDGKPMTYASGPDKGKVRTQKVTFFREPTQRDYDALRRAEEALKANWDRWEEMDLIPTERIPELNDDRPRIYGCERWCDMFTPRQLLGLLTAMETLHNMIPEIMKEHGKERGTAIVHYLQYMIDKLIDYNSRQTRWEYTRSVIKGTFGRHDFSLKWTYGEMIFTGASSGLAWGRDQILDAYTGICELMKGSKVSAPMILNGSAASMALSDKTADVICVDPPYYNNVQ